MLRAILTLATFSLAACQSTGGCPPLVKYSPEMQRRAAVELRALARGSAVADMIVDYKKTRDAIRACGGRTAS